VARETKSGSVRASEILLERAVLESDLNLIDDEPTRALPAQVESTVASALAEDMARERAELAHARAQLARDRELLARERATLAEEFARFDRTLYEAVERAVAFDRAEIERDRRFLEADREILASDRAAFEDDRRLLELDREALRAQLVTGARPDPRTVEALEAQRRELDREKVALDEARRAQSAHAKDLLEHEDDIAVERRRLEAESKRLDETVKERVHKALAAERARVAAKEAELDRKLSARKKKVSQSAH
jgi:hypothetical protein